MKNQILVFALLSSSTVGFATPTTFEVPQRSDVPTAVRASVSRDGKTWFFGKAPANFRMSETWLHFFSIATRRRAPKSDSASSVVFNPRDYVLNLWERVGTTRRKRFRRLNTVQLSGAEFLRGILFESDSGYTATKAYLLWLRESTRQTPVVRLSFVVGNGVNASTGGADLLFVFHNSLQNRPQIQQFVNFNELGGGASHSYDQTDEQGILKITRKAWVSSSVADTVFTETKFRWSGREFVAEGQATPVPQ